MMVFRPASLPVVGLIVPFVLLFVALYSTWRLFGHLRAHYLGREEETVAHKHLSTAICIGLVLVVVLQSLGQLSVRDVITLLAIVSLGYVYLGRSRFTVIKR